MFVRHRQRFPERGRLPFAGHRKEAVPAPQADQGRSPLRKVTLAHDFPIVKIAYRGRPYRPQTSLRCLYRLRHSGSNSHLDIRRRESAGRGSGEKRLGVY